MCASRQDPPPGKRGRKVRVPFRRNRSERARRKDWTREALQSEGHEIDAHSRESVVPKGALSRARTIIVREEESLPAEASRVGIVLVLRGLYADVDDGARVWPCTIRRILRTRLIEERHPVAVGDRVRFRLPEPVGGAATEGVIEEVAPRKGQLRRRVDNRVQTIAANVDLAVIVSSAAEPAPRPHLIDRYIVAALHGGIAPAVCINKIDLDADGAWEEILRRYRDLGYPALGASAVEGVGIDELRSLLRGKTAVLCGQSGVGKSALLNAIQPELGLRTAPVVKWTRKGRHTTTTAQLIKLTLGGYVVDTPGVRSFDLSIIPRAEYEAYFIEFIPFVPRCRFPDCAHTHEAGCAVKQAVEEGAIHPERYESYVRLHEDQTSNFD